MRHWNLQTSRKQAKGVKGPSRCRPAERSQKLKMRPYKSHGSFKIHCSSKRVGCKWCRCLEQTALCAMRHFKLQTPRKQAKGVKGPSKCRPAERSQRLTMRPYKGAKLCAKISKPDGVRSPRTYFEQKRVIPSLEPPVESFGFT